MRAADIRAIGPAVWLLVLAAGCDIKTSRQVVELTDDLSSMRVKSGPGAIQLRSSADDTVRIEGDLYGKHTDYSFESKDGELVVKRDCRLVHLRACWVDFIIYAPPDLDVELDSSSGDIDVEDWEGALDISTGAGSVSMYGGQGLTTIETGSGAIEVSWVQGDLNIITGSGDVIASDLSSDKVDVAGGSGDVDLELANSFDDLSVETGSGAVTAAIPTGTYRLDLESRSGTLSTSGVDQNNQAETTVHISTGSGDIDLIGQ